VATKKKSEALPSPKSLVPSLLSGNEKKAKRKKFVTIGKIRVKKKRSDTKPQKLSAFPS